MELPKYNDSSKKGEDGITLLKRFFEKEFKWIFRPNHKENDFGIDVYLDIILEYGQVTGKSIACQVKTGPSYFKEKNEAGWVYRGEMAHLNYYLNHDIPVMIIIVDEVEEKAYWCYCDPTKTERAGENWKITIPFGSVLTKESKREFEKHVSPVKDYVSQLEHFWKMNKMLKEHERLVFLIDREDLEMESYKELVAGLERIQVNHELIIHLKEKVDVWINDYDRDSRELNEIPEVKKWAKAIFDNVSGLSYFLVKNHTAQFFKVLQLCHMKHDRIPNSEHLDEYGIKKYKVEVDLRDMKFVEDLFQDLNEFTDKHNLTLEINKQITGNIIVAICGERPPGL